MGLEEVLELVGSGSIPWSRNPQFWSPVPSPMCSSLLYFAAKAKHGGRQAKQHRQINGKTVNQTHSGESSTDA